MPCRSKYFVSRNIPQGVDRRKRAAGCNIYGAALRVAMASNAMPPGPIRMTDAAAPMGFNTIIWQIQQMPPMMAASTYRIGI